MAIDASYRTSYSLPGHVIVTVPSLAAAPFDGSLALRQRLLKSMEITFEGKSEFFDEYGERTLPFEGHC